MQIQYYPFPRFNKGALNTRLNLAKGSLPSKLYKEKKVIIPRERWQVEGQEGNSTPQRGAHHSTTVPQLRNKGQETPINLSALWIKASTIFPSYKRVPT